MEHAMNWIEGEVGKTARHATSLADLNTFQTPFSEEQEMENQQVRNWFGSIVSFPSVVTEVENVQDIVAIVQDTEKYPSPIRAVGSNHSTTPCGVADKGTVVGMRKMNRILNIGADTVTAEAGALYIDVAKELQKHGLQFFVNVEIGNLTIGSAACGGTKDASMPGEFGQACSYAVAIKMVTPSGETVEVTEEQPELLQAVRASHGLFGIIYEATFRVKPLRSMAVHHETYSLDEFDRQLPALKARGESIMMYIDPFLDRITVEFRRYREDKDPSRASSWQWKLRNLVWSTLAPYFSYKVTKYVPIKTLRYFLINTYNRLKILLLVLGVRGENTLATGQMIRYPEKATNSRYTFSIWAFPEEDYISNLRDYFRFCHEYYRSWGYRPNLMNVGYRINRDTSSLFSYSFGGNVMTFDPVSTGDAGWEQFLVAYNDFCSRHGGSPLFNQSNSLTRWQVEKAFGDRLAIFESYRVRFDPTGRLLNEYFKHLLKQPSAV
jgi:FAD/FMN-containing dehydrogenase